MKGVHERQELDRISKKVNLSQKGNQREGRKKRTDKGKESGIEKYRQSHRFKKTTTIKTATMRI